MTRHPLRLESAATTDIGRVRATNEDAYVASSGLAFVADGVGGHAHGDVASAIVAGTLSSLEREDRLTPFAVITAVDRANRAVVETARRMLGGAGMGTTLSGVALVDHRGAPHWLVLNIGDSRVYRISSGIAHRLTSDHSEVAELVAAGQITSDQARGHPARHMITRSIGSDPGPLPDVWLVPARSGDVFVVCSDGVHDELRDDTIARHVSTGLDDDESLAVIANRLVGAAVTAGGHDNATVVVARAAGTEVGTPAAPAGTWPGDHSPRTWSTTPITLPRSLVRQLTLTTTRDQ